MSAGVADLRLVRQFNEYFQHWQVTLPEAEMDLPDGPVRISHSGWWITMIFGGDAVLPWLEIYAQHRMTNDRHIRFHTDKEQEILPALDEPIFIPENATEKEEQNIRDVAKERHKSLFAELQKVGLV